MEVSATAKFSRLSPQKARPVARKLQGLPVSEALQMMQFSKQKAAAMIEKTLKSAVANAQHNDDLEVDHLKVKEVIINQGPTYGRFWPRARGSASPILKKTSHIQVVLTDGAAPVEDAADHTAEDAATVPAESETN